MPQSPDIRLLTESKFNTGQSVQDGRLALLEGAAGFPEPPLGFEDAVVTALVDNQGSDTNEALGLQFTRKGELVMNVKDHGVVGDGVVDDTAALNAVAATAKTLGATLFIPADEYKITGPVVIGCALEASTATLKYYGTGEALIIGNNATAGAVTYRKRFALPAVVYGNTNNWDGTSVGVTLLNLNTCDVHVPWVQDFETNLLCVGRGTGMVHNTVSVGQLGQGHKNFVLTQDETGWCNSNTFLGGKLNCNAGRGAVLGDVNASMISLVKGSTTISGPNGNTFIGVSMEGENWAYHRVTFDGARFNTFLSCRWEVMNDTLTRVTYKNDSHDNRIVGGYDAWKIVETFDATSTGGQILDGQGAFLKAAIPTSTQLIPGGDVWTAITVWNGISARRIANAAGVFTPRAGRWHITATITFAPNATGRRRASILTSTGQTIDFGEVPGNAQRNTIKLNGTYKFNGVETFVIQVSQNSGADLNLEGTAGYVTLKAEMLSV